MINGSSEIDESLVTGETLYRAVRTGATIYAGSINVSGTLTVRVVAGGAGTMVDDVEQASAEGDGEAKSQTVRLADRAARLYAPLVHTTAALTAIGWLAAGASIHDSIVIAIAVLIITGVRARSRSRSPLCRSSPPVARCSSGSRASSSTAADATRATGLARRG